MTELSQTQTPVIPALPSLKAIAIRIIDAVLLRRKTKGTVAVKDNLRRDAGFPSKNLPNDFAKETQTYRIRHMPML